MASFQLTVSPPSSAFRTAISTGPYARCPPFMTYRTPGCHDQRRFAAHLKTVDVPLSTSWRAFRHIDDSTHAQMRFHGRAAPGKQHHQSQQHR
jgi:hypothetical protein